MPELLNGVRTALALSFILLVSAEMIASGVGKSGSPMPRSMTSAPLAMASALIREISAKR